MSARRKARRRAIDVLYSADLRDLPLEEAVRDATSRAESEPERLSTWEYASDILQGVLEHKDSLDAALERTSKAWPLERMPLVDRAILRVGAWELMHNPAVEAAVAISEAVEIASELSTEASPGFVHGVLAALADEHRMS